jgi:hypothetical protein
MANRVVNANGFNTAPRNVGGFTITPMGNGVTLGVLSDSSGAGQLRWNNFDTPPGGDPAATRMAAVGRPGESADGLWSNELDLHA